VGLVPPPPRPPELSGVAEMLPRVSRKRRTRDSVHRGQPVGAALVALTGLALVADSGSVKQRETLMTDEPGRSCVSEVEERRHPEWNSGGGTEDNASMDSLCPPCTSLDAGMASAGSEVAHWPALRAPGRGTAAELPQPVERPKDADSAGPSLIRVGKACSVRGPSSGVFPLVVEPAPLLGSFSADRRQQVGVRAALEMGAAHAWLSSDPDRGAPRALVLDPGPEFGAGAGGNVHRHLGCPVWAADGVVGPGGWLPAVQAVRSELNLPAWRARLRGYEDVELLHFLEFGFPSFSDCAPVVVLARNLSSVCAFERRPRLTWSKRWRWAMWCSQWTRRVGRCVSFR